MNTYGLQLFVHVLAVILWVGSGVVFQAIAERAVARRDVAHVRTLVDMSEALGKAFFGILTAAVLATGIGLVLEGGWGFDEPFVLGGIVGLVVSAGLGGAVIGRTADRLTEATRGAQDYGDDVHGLMTKLRNVGRLDFVIMVTVVFLMTVKPGS